MAKGCRLVSQTVTNLLLSLQFMVLFLEFYINEIISYDCMYFVWIIYITIIILIFIHAFVCVNSLFLFIAENYSAV